MIGSYVLNNAYVTNDGKISNHGTIRILGNAHKTTRKDVGLLLYSDKFLRFRGKGNKAQIYGQAVFVRNNKGDILVTVGMHEIFSVFESFSGKYRVMAGGWLRPAPGSPKYQLGDFIPAKLLRKGEKSKEPLRLDNSAFYKVDPSLKGRIVYLIRTAANDNLFRIIDSKGNLVNGEMKRPVGGIPTSFPLSDDPDWRDDDLEDAG